MYTVVVTDPNGNVVSQTNFYSEFAAWKYWTTATVRSETGIQFSNCSVRFIARPLKRAA